MADIIGQILVKLEFSGQIFEKYTIWNLIKIRPVDAQLFHADRHDEAKCCFSQFFKVYKIWSSPLNKMSPDWTGKLYKTVLIVVNKQPATIFLYGSFWNVIWSNRTADTPNVGQTYKSVTWRTPLWIRTFDFDNDLKLFKADSNVLANNVNQ